MKRAIGLLFIGIAMLIVGASCSKCYECQHKVVITDAKGNPIDTTTKVEDVCTSNKSEINDKEAQGFKCS